MFMHLIQLSKVGICVYVTDERSLYIQDRSSLSDVALPKTLRLWLALHFLNGPFDVNKF